MSLQNVVKNTTDHFAKGQYQATLDGKRQQLKNYQDTTEALNRWHAQLTMPSPPSTPSSPRSCASARPKC